ncbi:MAG TPA: exodeoxyribonuclease VII large subunit [Baekduia sp.]|nr:exodeoxyribonuclease VII large subunit [Baekduia sp.]
MPERLAPEGIAGLDFKGPYSVGRYAAFLRERFREIARVQIHGEVWNVRSSKAKVYFELRDGDGALQCSMWRDAFDELNLPNDALVDGAQVVVGGGPDFYPGSRTAASSFSFAVTGLRIAGEGDLLSQLEVLRKALAAEGLFEPQKALARPALPRSIGVITGERGKARDDVMAGLRRRGWAGRVVWAFAPVQDRHAAGAISERLRDLAAVGSVDVIIVARGGGSLADLFAFCDESLCRTVALLGVPVIASVGHHTDRMLIDDVAAVRCSTPTHAAEVAVPLSPAEQRIAIAKTASALQVHGRRAVTVRGRQLSALARGPAQHLARHNTRLHQQLRELRAGGRRRIADEIAQTRTAALVLQRKAHAAGGPELQRRRMALASLAAAIDAHDPANTLRRGYAMVEDASGELVTSAKDARAREAVTLSFADGKVSAHVEKET